MSELKHEGNRPDRARDLMPERVFAEEWKKENERVLAVNFGLIALELILNSNLLTQQAFGHNYFADLDRRPTQRDATVAATVIQWLGTNCGKCFLDRCETQVKQERERERIAFNERWNKQPNPTLNVPA